MPPLGPLGPPRGLIGTGMTGTPGRPPRGSGSGTISGPRRGELGSCGEEGAGECWPEYSSTLGEVACGEGDGGAEEHSVGEGVLGPSGSNWSAFGTKMTDAKLSSESTLVSLCKLKKRGEG